MISVGMLYDAQKLLELVDQSRVSAADLLSSFKKLETADFPAVLSLAQQCQWIEVDPGNVLILSTPGRKIHVTDGPALRLRCQLRDILGFVSPSWAKKIADGRSEAVKIMPDAARQIFEEAGLLNEWSDELVSWWDEIGLAARSRKNERNLKTGRKAERLSMEFEEERTGRRPTWTCADTNYAGFDILSIIDRGDPRPCAIEVKGSTQHLNEAHFTLSRNEWGVAESNSDFRLHLWLIRNAPAQPARDLRVITSDELGGHISVDQGEGKWATVAVPFAAFWNN